MDMVTKWEDNRERFEANPGAIPDSEITADLKEFLTGGTIPFP